MYCFDYKSSIDNIILKKGIKEDSMLIKTEKLVHIKKNSKNFINVVREHYLRDDIPCKSSSCSQGCEQPKGQYAVDFRTYMPYSLRIHGLKT